MRAYGAMISFVIKGAKKEASQFLSALQIFTLAESLGGVESIYHKYICLAFLRHIFCYFLSLFNL